MTDGNKVTKWTSISVFAIIALNILSSVLFVQRGLTGERTSLNYHRGVDQRVYEKSPRKHERLEYGEGKKKFYFYVELTPTRQIPASAIEAVIIQKERKFGRTPDEMKAFEEAVKKDFKAGVSQTDAVPDTYPFGFVYSITFKLTLPEWKREVAFTNKHMGERFQLRLEKYDLGLVDFLVPFEVDQPPEFTIYTFEDDANSISKMLSSLKDKIKWK